MRKEKGITLVSLVVTIIILIILAGISIHTLVGQNGIITRAQQAKENMVLAEQKEKEYLNNLYEQIEGSNQGVPPEEGTIGDLTNRLQDLQNKFDSLQTEYNTFKSSIATAITEKGVETLETDTEETMTENIKKIGSSIDSIYYVQVTNASWGGSYTYCYLTEFEHYQDITIDNIIFADFGVWATADGSSITDVVSKYAYEPSTGKLTLKCIGSTTDSTWKVQPFRANSSSYVAVLYN